MRSGSIVRGLLGIGVTSLALALPARAWAGPFTTGVGVIGVAGGSFLGKPGDRTIKLPSGAEGRDDGYPGFGGFGLGAGIMLDARLFDLAGLELDIIRKSDRGHGDLTINGTETFTIEIGQAAWHVPILAKIAAPIGILRPMFVIGPELVFPGTADAKVTSSNASLLLTKLDATADNYVMLTLGLGVEIKLPLPVIDLRIPFQVRGSLRPGTTDKVSERVDYKFNSAGAVEAETFHSEWQYQVYGTLGASLHF